MQLLAVGASTVDMQMQVTGCIDAPEAALVQLESETLFISGPAKDSLLSRAESLIKSNRVTDETAQAYYQLSHYYYKLQQSDSAIVLVNKAITLSKQLGNLPQEAYARKSLAQYYWSTGEYLVAVEHSDASLQIFKGLKDTLGIAKSSLIRGVLCASLGNYTLALQCFSTSLMYSDKLHDNETKQSSYNNIANVYDALGNYPKALEYHYKALDMYEASGNKGGVGNSLHNIGVVYYGQENYAKALDYFEKALKIREINQDRKGMASTYTNLGMVYDDLGRRKQAAIHFKRAAEIFQQLGYELGKATVYSNMGTYYLNGTDTTKASLYFNKSMDIAKWLGHTSLVAENYHGMGKLAFKKGNMEMAEYYSKKAYESALSIGQKKLLRDASKQLAQLYASLRQFQKAYEYHCVYSNTSDSLLNASKLRTWTEIEYQVKFEQLKKENENDQKEQQLLYMHEMAQATTMRNYILVAIASLFLVLIFIYRSSRIRHKANRKLQISNDMVNMQKEKIERHKDVLEAKQLLLNAQNKKIRTSLQYAHRIQQASLPTSKQIKVIFPQHFVLYLPKDIVSGDFYWARQIGSYKIIVAADCIGHGVAGAFMSMLGIAFLNEVTRYRGLNRVNLVLEELRSLLKQTLHSDNAEDGSSAEGGIDMAICAVDLENNTMQYAGAFCPLFLIREGVLIEYKPTYNPVGAYVKELDFEIKDIHVEAGDSIYLFSDGYMDQFGGDSNKKFQSAPFKRMLLDMQQYNMEQQKRHLEREFNRWRGELQQVDDVLVVGVKL